MAKSRVFISFDAEHDQDLRVLLVGQAKHSDTPFELADWSVKQELTGDWKAKVQEKIRKVDQVVVICGEYTDSATGVSTEIEIARAEKKPYFLLKGRSDKSCKKPKAAKDADKVYSWTWENLKKLIGGAR
jgi:hypothetical protein